MNWPGIARKDFADAIRSKTVLVLLVVFVLVYVSATAVIWSYGDATFEEFTSLSNSIMVPFVALIGLALGYKSIIGERDSGSIKLVLSLPYSRRDLLVGKFVGRSLVLAVPILVGFLAATAMLLVGFESVSPAPLVGYFVLTILYGMGFVSIGLSLSASTTDQNRVLLGAVGTFILLYLFWVPIVNLGYAVVYRFQLRETPGWVEFLRLVASPRTYADLVETLVNGSGGTVFDVGYWFGTPWFGIVVLVAWIVAPVAIGYWYLRSADM